MRHFFRLIFGLALVALGVVAVLFLAKLSLPAPVEIVLANEDIYGGATIDRGLFRVEQVRGLDRAYWDVVTKDEFLSVYEGGVLADGAIIYAGFPLSPRQVIFSDTPNPDVDRLTLLTDPANTVFPIDVKPGQVGNFVKPGDYVDLVFTVGRVESGRIDIPPEPTIVPSLNEVGVPPDGALPPTPTPLPPPPAGSAYMATPSPTPPGLELPMAVVSLPDVLVLRVEREQVPNYAAGAPGLGVSDANQPAYLDGDVIRIYVELAPDDAAIAAFLLASGSVVAPSHRAELDAPPYGLTWTDFKNWFLSRRPDLFPGADLPTPKGDQP
ncbi:MAG: hypothetical protein JXB47_15530 [Anaerolineae bacterium]|nr:hypothetical protein [Anaerolineae bacterium]